MFRGRRLEVSAGPEEVHVSSDRPVPVVVPGPEATRHGPTEVTSGGQRWRRGETGWETA